MTRTLPRRSATKAKEAREAEIHGGTTKTSLKNDGKGLLALDGYNSEEDEDWDPDADEGEEDIDMESSDDDDDEDEEDDDSGKWGRKGEGRQEEGKKKGNEQGAKKKIENVQPRKGVGADVSRRKSAVGRGRMKGAGKGDAEKGGAGKEDPGKGVAGKENGSGDDHIDGGDSDGDIDDSGNEGRGNSRSEGEGYGSEADESSGGEGGQVKTRSQRAKLAKEKAPLATIQGATADVDKLWMSMNQQAWSKRAECPTGGGTGSRKTDMGTGTRGGKKSKVDDLALEGEQGKKSARLGPDSDSGGTSEKKMINGVLHITISQTYTFAGKTHTENKLVPADSAEARLYLSTHAESQSPPAHSLDSPTRARTATATAPQKTPIRRPLKRASNFDSGSLHANAKAQKMNTLDKSKLDWAGFVDQEGIKDELDRQGKGGGYVDRQAFLGRVDERREGLWREGLKKK